MTTDSAIFSVTLAAVKGVSESGTHLVGAQEFAALTGSGPADRARFAENWNDLKLGTPVTDDGTLRYRRHDQFVVDVEAERLILLQHRLYPYEQLTAKFLDDPLFRTTLMELALIFSGVEGVNKWNVKVTPVRIVATRDDARRPAPEGWHGHGATFIASLTIGRAEADLLLSDDRRTRHEVAAVCPREVGEPARRDVLIMAYTAL